ncbi:MAG: thiamine phosphate synthase, partial [Planctomycetaceae bacterium]|nr:thiamine phosphate synthase [Planctomycetaceae bacterium]
MQQFRPTSEAVTRVLRLTAKLAHIDSQKAEEPHLLAALWLDESVARGLLEQAGLTDETIRDLLGDDVFSLTDTESTTFKESDTPSHLPKLSTVITAAQSHAGQLGRHAEMGTEHLLMGLISQGGPLADQLIEQGITLESIKQHTADETGSPHEPIPVDITLSPTIVTRQDTTHTDRILDAAANRCREGLRVVEDFTRFVLDDAHLSRLLKDLRHDLTAALAMLPTDRLLRSRDTPGDVGTRIDTSAERQRLGPHHVARANAKRVEESLRTLEEYGKVMDAEFAARCEALRYRFYTTEQAIETTHNARERLADCRLYLLVTDRNCPHGAGPLIRDALAGGVDAIQLREKDMPDRRLLDLAHRVREWTAEAGALFIVNDRPDIAALSRADGVHLGQDDLTVREARQIIGANALIGVSTHNIDQARQAVTDGADYLGVGPTFP